MPRYRDMVYRGKGHVCPFCNRGLGRGPGACQLEIRFLDREGDPDEWPWAATWICHADCVRQCVQPADDVIFQPDRGGKARSTEPGNME